MTAIAKITFILLIVVELTAGSSLVAVACGIDSDSRIDACSTQDVNPCGAGETDACCPVGDPGDPVPPADEDCCPPDGGECLLGCCAGMVSVLSPVLIVDVTETSVHVTREHYENPSLVCEREIDHPPQLASL